MRFTPQRITLWCRTGQCVNGTAFANPPYSTAKQHEGEYITGMRHTHGMRELGGRYVFLIKSATSEVWWPENADHVAFIRGRIGFDVPLWYRLADARQEATSAGFGAAIAIFDKAWRGPAHSYVSREQLMAHGEVFLAQIRREAMRMVKRCAALRDHRKLNLRESTRLKRWVFCY